MICFALIRILNQLFSDFLNPISTNYISSCVPDDNGPAADFYLIFLNLYFKKSLRFWDVAHGKEV